MQNFKLTQIKDQKVLTLKLQGDVEMESLYPDVDLKDIHLLNLDFSEVSYINSIGIRKWLLWTWQITRDFPDLRMTLNDIPQAIVKQMSCIDKFIPATAKIESVQIPYFCDNCNKEMRCRLTHGLHYGDGFTQEQVLKNLNNKLICDECGSSLEIDVNVSTYLKVLME